MNIASVASLVMMGLVLVTGGCSSGEGCREIIEEKCSSCHSVQKTCDEGERNKAYWNRTVDHMIQMRAPLTEGEREKVVNCLVKTNEAACGEQ